MNYSTTCHNCNSEQEVKYLYFYKCKPYCLICKKLLQKQWRKEEAMQNKLDKNKRKNDRREYDKMLNDLNFVRCCL